MAIPLPSTTAPAPVFSTTAMVPQSSLQLATGASSFAGGVMSNAELTAAVLDLGKMVDEIHAFLLGPQPTPPQPSPQQQLLPPPPPSSSTALFPYGTPGYGTLLLTFQDVQPTTLPFPGMDPMMPLFQGVQPTAPVPIKEPWTPRSPSPIPSTMGPVYTMASTPAVTTMAPQVKVFEHQASAAVRLQAAVRGFQARRRLWSRRPWRRSTSAQGSATLRLRTATSNHVAPLLSPGASMVFFPWAANSNSTTTAVGEALPSLSPVGTHCLAPPHSATGRREGAFAVRCCDHF